MTFMKLTAAAVISLAACGTATAQNVKPTVEMTTHPDKELSLPVHQVFLVVNGILNLESVKSDEIAQRGFTAFAFVMQPIKMEGGTGSAVFPLAIR